MRLCETGYVWVFVLSMDKPFRSTKIGFEVLYAAERFLHEVTIADKPLKVNENLLRRKLSALGSVTFYNLQQNCRICAILNLYVLSNSAYRFLP